MGLKVQDIGGRIYVNWKVILLECIELKINFKATPSKKCIIRT